MIFTERRFCAFYGLTIFFILYTILLVTEQIFLFGISEERPAVMEDQEMTGSAGDVGRMIHRVSHQLKRQMCVRTEEDSLTNMQRRVLHYILFESLQRDIYQKDVEEEFSLRPSSATELLKKMEVSGLILRVAEEKDARLKRIILTKEALSFNEEVQKGLSVLNSDITKGIKEKDIETFRKVCAKMMENIEL